MRFSLYFRVLPLCFWLSACGDVEAPSQQSDSFSVSANDHGQFPQMMFVAEPPVVSDGESVTLRWTASTSDQCVASGGWTGGRAAAGSETSAPLQEDTVFLLSCSEGNRSGLLKLQVQVQAITPEVELATDHEQVPVNGQTTLHWLAQGARICRASGGWQGDLPTQGSWQTGPLNRSTSYHLTCISDAGTALSSISVGIIPSAGVPG